MDVTVLEKKERERKVCLERVSSFTCQGLKVATPSYKWETKEIANSTTLLGFTREGRTQGKPLSRIGETEKNRVLWLTRQQRLTC